MCGRRYVTGLSHIRVVIYYDKTKRHVSFFVTYSTAYLHLQFKCTSVELLNDMKTKTKFAVESLYDFDTSQAPQSISRNADRAQALLADTTFIYRVYLIVSPRSQPSNVMWVIGIQFWWGPTLSISTLCNPESCQYHVVPEQGRHRYYLS